MCIRTISAMVKVFGPPAHFFSFVRLRLGDGGGGGWIRGRNNLLDFASCALFHQLENIAHVLDIL